MRIGLAAAAVALGVYLLTLAPGLTEIDSGELATCAATLGIAHPSGYPLFSFLGRVWTLLPVPLRVITWMNALSAVLCAGTVLLLARVVADLLPDRPGRGLAAWTAATAFAFHRTLWSVAVVTEVHALQMFLDAALLHAVVRAGLWGRRPLRESALLLTGYLGGLCLANHLTSALLLPGVAIGVWRRRAQVRRPVLLEAIALGALGASAYAFLPIRSAQGPLLDWGAPHTWEAFWRHVTGAQYRVWIFTSADTLGENLPRLLRGLTEFSWPLLALAPVGLWRARAVPGLFAGTLAMAVPAAVYPLGYGIHDIATYFLPPLLITAVWIGLGAAAVREAAERSAIARRLAPAIAALPLVPLIGGWKEADRSHDATVEAMARSFLETPARDSVVVTAYWDVLFSPSLYLQSVEGVRGDLLVLDQEHFRRRMQVPWLRRHHPEALVGLEAEADRLHELVLRFERGQPYDPAEIQGAFVALLDGLLEWGARRGGAYVTQEVEREIGAPRVRVPDGLLLRLEPLDAEAGLGPEPPWPELPPPGTGGPWAERARGYAAQMAALAGMLALRLGDGERARTELRRALAWNPDDPLARRGWSALEAAGEGRGGS